MPDATLLQKLDELSARLSALEEQNAHLRKENERLKGENQLLRQKLDHYIRHYFGGSRNEGLDRKQMELLLQGLPAVVVLEAPQSKAHHDARPGSMSRPMRRVLSEDKLETVEMVLEPVEVKAQPEGWRKISEERTTLLDYKPGKFFRKIYIRPRYVRQECFALAPLPALPVAQGMVGPGLLAQIILSKYAHHLPLYRQEKIFQQQHGVEVSRKTMGFWVEQAAELLSAVYRAMCQELLKGDYLQADETPIRYLDPDIKGKSQKGFMWGYSHPKGDVVFLWSLSRSAQVPEEFLKEFSGKLQTDGYIAYESLAARREGLILVGCWAHVRRGFVEALSENKLAGWFVLQIGLLYRVERWLRERQAGPALRVAVRAWQSQPVLRRLRAGMQIVRTRTLPQGALGQAIDYALSRWENLTRFVEDGQLEIDNNLLENAIRPSALGKKNWLFIGHPEAGQRSAIIYSLLGSCHRHGINPFDYLKDLFTRLPAARITQIADFTPAAWAEARTKPPPVQVAA